MLISVLVFNAMFGSLAVFTEPYYKMIASIDSSQIKNGTTNRSDLSTDRIFWNLYHKNANFQVKYDAFAGLIIFVLIVTNLCLLVSTVIMIGKHSWNGRKLKIRVAQHRCSITELAPPRNTRSRVSMVMVNNFIGSFNGEMKLTIYGLFLLVCFFMSFGHSMSLFVYRHANRQPNPAFEDFRNILLNLSVDVFGVVNPFGLVLMSSVVRDKMTAFLLCARESEFSALGQKINHFLSLCAIVYFVTVVMLIFSIFDITSTCLNHGFVYIDRTFDLSCQKAMQCI